MNYADLETAWRSPDNRPAAAVTEALRREFVADLRRRRRGLALFLTAVLAVLTLVTVRFAVFALQAPSAREGVDFGREWAAGPFLLLPWLAAVGVAVAAWRHRTRHAGYDRSIADGLRALLDENRLSRARLRTVAWLHGTMLLLLPLVVGQLRAVGKAGDEILVPAFVVWPLLVAVILAGMAWHYRRTLQPRQRELEALLKAYE